MIRIDPLDLVAVTAGAGSTPVTARIDLDRVDRCPAIGCGKPMSTILASDIPCFICWEHRVVLPQPDPEPATASTEQASPDTDVSAEPPMPVPSDFRVTTEDPVVEVEKPGAGIVVTSDPETEAPC